MKLHLGCGKRFFPGFIHVDLDSYPHIDYQHDIKKLPMFKNNTVDLIYFCHGVEYFDRFEVLDVLKEWRRVLKKGGKLRLAVPDFEALVSVYKKTGELDRVIGPIYGRIKIKTRKGEEFLYHKTTYDFKSLRRVLEQSGYVKIKRYNWRQTEHHQYDDFSQAYFPHMQKETGKLISLNVEATKP